MCTSLLNRSRKGVVGPLRYKLPAFIAEGSSKALDDVKPPAEEEVILDFYEETLRGEPSIVVFSEGGFVI